MLTQQQIQLIQADFAAVKEMIPEAASLFYGRLFELDPSVRSLFKGDMNVQGVKLFAMIDEVVAKLDRLDEVAPAVQDLGRRHAGYAVQKQHYDTVGAALVWTLAQGLGEGFTPAHEEAWTICYGVLAETMKEAA